MASHCAPHIQTHQDTRQSRKLQLAAGATGITCQKLGEVEVFVNEGVDDDILITFNIVGGGEDRTAGRGLPNGSGISRLSSTTRPVARGISNAARRERRRDSVSRRMRYRVLAETAWRRRKRRSTWRTASVKMPGLRFEGIMAYPNRPETGGFSHRGARVVPSRRHRRACGLGRRHAGARHSESDVRC